MSFVGTHEEAAAEIERLRTKLDYYKLKLTTEAYYTKSAVERAMLIFNGEVTRCGCLACQHRRFTKEDQSCEWERICDGKAPTYSMDRWECRFRRPFEALLNQFGLTVLSEWPKCDQEISESLFSVCTTSRETAAEESWPDAHFLNFARSDWVFWCFGASFCGATSNKDKEFLKLKAFCDHCDAMAIASQAHECDRERYTTLGGKFYDENL